MSVDTELDLLEASGLIRLAAVQPELLYLFRHWLVQDAAYSSLLKQERRELHRRVGEALERLYPETQAEHAAELAVHFERAELWDRAIPYLMAAGRYALDRYANLEARAFFDRAAHLLESDGDSSDRVRLRVEAAVGRVRSGFSMKPFKDELPVIEAVLPAAEQLADDALLLDVFLWIGMLRQALGERYDTSPALHQALDRASELGASLGNPALSALPLAIVGMSQVRGGELRAGTATLEKVIPLLEERHAFIGASMALDTLSLGYARLGEFARAREAAERAELFAGEGDPIAKLDARIVKANLESMSGNLSQAHDIAQQCVSQADALGSPACAVFSRFVLGDVQLRQGQPELAKPTLERGDVLAFGAAFVRPLVAAWLASARAELGDAGGARQAWDSAIADAASVGDHFTEAAIRLRRAASLARQPDPPWSEILTDLDVSGAVFEEAEARPFLADALALRGRALMALGRPDEGKAHLERAAQVLESVGLGKKADALRGQPVS